MRTIFYGIFMTRDFDLKVKEIHHLRQNTVYPTLLKGQNVWDGSECGTGKTSDMTEFLIMHDELIPLILCPTYEVCNTVSQLFAANPHELAKLVQDQRVTPCVIFRSKYAHDPDHPEDPKKYMCMRGKSERSFPGCYLDVSEYTLNELKVLKKYVKNDYHVWSVDDDITHPFAYECSFREICAYQRQIEEFKEIGEIPVITTVELGRTVNEILIKQGIRVNLVVWEESFEDKLIKQLTYGYDRDGNERVLKITAVDCARYGIGFKTTLISSEKNDDCRYKMVTLKDLHIRVTDPKSYAIKAFFGSTDPKHLIARQYGNQTPFYTFFGLWTGYLPAVKRKTPWLMNSASVTKEIVQILLNPKGFVSFEPLILHRNPMLWVVLEAYLAKSEDLYASLVEFLRGIQEKGKTSMGIGTKLRFEQRIQNDIPGIHVAHYKQLGSNTLDLDYDLVVIFCGYADKPQILREFSLLGFTESMIDQFQISTSQQMIGRFRLLLHPDVPVLSIVPKWALAKFDKQRTKRITRPEFKLFACNEADDAITYKIQNWLDWYVYQTRKSPIKHQVIKMIAEGKSNAEIIDVTGCARSHLSQYRHSIGDDRE